MNLLNSKASKSNVESIHKQNTETLKIQKFGIGKCTSLKVIVVFHPTFIQP